MHRTPVQFTRTGRLVLAMVVTLALGNMANAAVANGSATRGAWTRCLCEAARQIAGVQAPVSNPSAQIPERTENQSIPTPTDQAQQPTLIELPTLLDLPPPTLF